MLYRGALFMNRLREAVCQCPLGLIPHFYSTTKNYALYIGVFQCPHGLKLLLERAHAEMVELRFNALMGLSCYVWLSAELKTLKEFQCHHGLELLR